MKRSYLYLIFLIGFTAQYCEARVALPGESLWSMQRLVMQASCDVTLRQSDLSAGVVTISNAGVYCLAENITGKIIIDQDNVVLDLNGKTITNTADDCIEVNGKSKIIIKNGSVISSNNIGIHIESGSSQVTLEKIVTYDSNEGMFIESSSNVYVNACDFIASTTGVILNNASRTIFSNTTASDSVYIGFLLASSSKNQFLNCTALNTGQGLTDELADIYGFLSTNGSSNIFTSCIAQNTLASTVIGSSSVAAGFALSGTESDSHITHCTSNITETDSDGFSTPFGILLQYSFDTLTSVTGEGQGTVAETVSWSPDGAYLATGGDGEFTTIDDEIQIFSFDRSAETLTTITGESQGTLCHSVAWSPDGVYLATGGNTEGSNDEIQVFSFDPVSGLLTRKDGVSLGTSGYSVAWSPNGAYLAAGGASAGTDDIQLFSFDRSTGQLAQTDVKPQGNLCRSVAWSPDGAYLATGGDPENGNEIQIFSFDRATETLAFLTGEDQGTTCYAVAWAPDGAYLASGGTEEGVDDIRVFNAFIFPSRNNISNNDVQSASGPSPLVAGVGISGSSIENLITGNSSYNNAGFNYQFVTNVFDSRFTEAPTLLQNLSINTTFPFYAP